MVQCLSNFRRICAQQFIWFAIHFLIFLYASSQCVTTEKSTQENSQNDHDVCGKDADEADMSGELWGNPNKEHVSCNRPENDIPSTTVKMSTDKIGRLSPVDPTSFSRPDLCVVKHLHLKIDVDFEKHILKGSVKLTVQKVDVKATSLVLDSKYLTIHNVYVDGTGQKLKYSIGEPVGQLGSKLEIQLPADCGNECAVVIEYETSPSPSQCQALQWLRAEQTAGKKHPYLFSQCQAIHARTIIPCQDSPAVKVTYSAEISCPAELTALMSAVPQGKEPSLSDASKAVHRFQQNVSIPSYLIAIVVGALESRTIGPRSKVWSEKEMVDAAAHEFAETEEMLKTAEELCGPYLWGVYDLLILPPSFPYGGMENPCLTFVTPTLLAGDRSLSTVVAHEISHSWTGNLVTTKTWEHFWLNEGHTVFIEQKIIGRMKSEASRYFHAIAGWRALAYQVNEVFGKDHPHTQLVPDLTGIDPDDAFSTVPYVKGSSLLMYLEQKVGGNDVFEPFLRAYVENFKHKSITTDDWKEFLLTYFNEKAEQGVFDDVDWNAWLYKPGMPPKRPQHDFSLMNECESLGKKWQSATDDSLSQFTPDDLKSFTSLQKQEFLSYLLEQEPLSASKINKLEELYGFGSVQNSEIKFRWIRLGLMARMKESIQMAVDFVTQQGRMKFVRPLYRDLYLWEDSREAAIENFNKTKGSMNGITAKMVAQDLKVSI